MTAQAGFDLVKAAEALLEDAKKLAAITTAAATANGAVSNGHQNGHASGGPAPPSSVAMEVAGLQMGIAIAAKKIALEVASPADVVKADWVTFVDVACLDIFMEWKAFDKIPLDGSISYAELASAIDAQESLVARIAGLLISVGKLQADPNSPLDRVQHSRISPLYRSKSMFGPLATVAVGNGMKPVSRWAEYFARYGRHEPRGQTHTPFSFAWGHPELPPWEVKALYPEYAIRFTKSMKSRQIVGGNMPVAGPSALYDMSWIGGEADKRKGPLVVDVGGGLGQLLRDVVTAVPGVSPERCVLQDRKEVIDEAMAGGDEVIQQVTVMDHDFHTEQPVKGALVYLLRRILLDYSDELATGILRQLANALPADDEKARVIIMEERLLSTPVPANRIVDIFMLNLGGKLRNEKTFGEIARTAGLKVVKFYAREGEPTCVVECAKA